MSALPGRWLRPGSVLPLARTALLLQMVLVVSGAAVRLSNSGLGCPSWPTCTSSSLSTTPALGLHGAIEFGNRTLAVVMETVGVLLVLAVRRHAPQLARLALVQVLVVPVQAVIGGILVLSGLNPWVLIVHFLTSFPLVYCAVWLLRRLLDLSAPTPAPAQLAPVWHRLSLLLLAAAATVLVAGTLVTGTGPHAGSPDVERLPFDPLTVTRLHTDVVYVLLGLVLALTALTWSHPALRRWCLGLCALVAGQGALGYWQYFHGVPPFAVGVHVAGAVCIFTTASWLQLSSRGDTPGVRVPGNARISVTPRA